MSDLIEKYLRTNGPALSSKISEYLAEELGLSPEAARKRVSRAAGEVKKLAYVTFPRKARYMYLEQHFGAPWYWDNLIAALVETNSAFGHALAALRLRDGITREAHFPIICGAPVKQLKHLSPEGIYTRLNQAGLLEKITVPALGPCIALVQAPGYYDQAAMYMHAKLITESVLLAAVKDWLRNLGFVSYGRVATRDDPTYPDLPRVSTFAWDLTAPSYLGHMVKYGRDGKAKPGFIACDVHLGEEVTVEGIRPFIHKCRILRNLRNVGPCMQMFVADKYDEDAFRLLKENGILPATPANLFGEVVAEGLRKLTGVLHKAAVAAIDPAEFDELFKRLSGIEGATHQLRGTLFEYLAGEMARRTISPNVRMNRIFKSAGQTGEAEADVVAVKENMSVTFIECKGYNPRGVIPIEEVQHWLQHAIPIFYREAKAHPDWKNHKIEFEFWATAPLSDEAMALFEKYRGEIK
ncbi:MAG: hypothetical protein ACOH2M_18625, partial [Cypionkella sp.]